MPSIDFEGCPISPAADLIFSKWTSAVLWTLDRHGRLRFTELRRAMPAITSKVLAQRLRQLERDGLVTREYHAEMPPRVEYELTELARSLTPIFVSLGDWSDRHFDEVLAARARFEGTDEALRA